MPPKRRRERGKPARRTNGERPRKRLSRFQSLPDLSAKLRVIMWQLALPRTPLERNQWAASEIAVAQDPETIQAARRAREARNLADRRAQAFAEWQMIVARGTEGDARAAAMQQAREVRRLAAEEREYQERQVRIVHEELEEQQRQEMNVFTQWAEIRAGATLVPRMQEEQDREAETAQEQYWKKDRRKRIAVHKWDMRRAETESAQKQREEQDSAARIALEEWEEQAREEAEIRALTLSQQVEWTAAHRRHRDREERKIALAQKRQVTEVTRIDSNRTRDELAAEFRDATANLEEENARIGRENVARDTRELASMGSPRTRARARARLKAIEEERIETERLEALRAKNDKLERARVTREGKAAEKRVADKIEKARITREVEEAEKREVEAEARDRRIQMFEEAMSRPDRRRQESIDEENDELLREESESVELMIQRPANQRLARADHGARVTVIARLKERLKEIERNRIESTMREAALYERTVRDSREDARRIILEIVQDPTLSDEEKIGRVWPHALEWQEGMNELGEKHAESQRLTSEEVERARIEARREMVAAQDARRVERDKFKRERTNSQGSGQAATEDETRRLEAEKSENHRLENETLEKERVARAEREAYVAELERRILAKDRREEERLNQQRKKWRDSKTRGVKVAGLKERDGGLKRRSMKGSGLRMRGVI